MKYNLAIIDADSLVYLIGSKYKTIKVRASALNALDDIIMDILKVSYAKEYFGFFGKTNGAKNYRYDIAKTKPYKGTRPAKEPWYVYWEPILKNHMEKVWKFTPVEYIEADDICLTYAEVYKNNPNYLKIIVCSPDKDLKQMEDTWNYDYRNRIMSFIPAEVAVANLFTQCIEGDTADNIQGLPGCGKKAAEVFKTTITGFSYDKAKKATLTYYAEYLNVTLPIKQVKQEEKKFLIKYKEDNNLSRFNKDTKKAALAEFNKDGNLCIPKNKKAYIDLFDENLALLYMLRTITDIQKYWKTYIEEKPNKEIYMDWEQIDKDRELIDVGLNDNNFDDDEAFLTDFDDLDILIDENLED